MEGFWGVEVKPGQTLTCESLKNDVINLTQVALGNTTSARENERVSVYLWVDKKMIVLGTLTHGRCDQIGLNLIFNKTFEISHSSEYASLFFCGYSRNVPEWKQSVRRANDSDEDDKDFEDSSSSDDENEEGEDEDDDNDEDEGTPTDSDTKTPRTAKKGKVATPEDDSDDDEEGEDDEDEDMEDVSRSDDMDEEGEDEVDSSGDDEDEEISKVHAGNKRPMPALCIKTPKTNKKAKVVTPQGQKPGAGKKYVQFATCYDSGKKGAKKGKRTPGGSKQQPLSSKKTPKSSGTPWPGKKGHSVAKQTKGS